MLSNYFCRDDLTLARAIRGAEKQTQPSSTERPTRKRASLVRALPSNLWLMPVIPTYEWQTFFTPSKVLNQATLSNGSAN
jgi:hypothetical protein